MRLVLLITLIMALPINCLGEVRVLFSHQSVGRHVVAEPERAEPTLRATAPIRDFLNENVNFWDHDYYNYSTDLVTPGVLVPGSLLDPDGEIFSIGGFGSHRGAGHEDVLLSHLLGEAFCDTPDTDGRAFRDSCLSRFEIVMIKPGYRDLHMNTGSSLAEYQQTLNDVADWWHQYNIEHETNIFLVVMSGSSLRHPSDYSGGTAGWADNAAGHAEAEADVAAYRQLDLWMQNEWSYRHPELRYFSTFEHCVNLSGSRTEKFFTKDSYTGTGEGSDSGDHHLNTAGSNDLQELMVTFINDLAYQVDNNLSATGEIRQQSITLFDPKPNPFNPTTAISFETSEALPVNLSIYDVSGKHVVTLVNEIRSMGRHEVFWNGQDHTGSLVSSGVYFARIASGSFQENKRMTLIK